MRAKHLPPFRPARTAAALTIAALIGGCATGSASSGRPAAIDQYIGGMTALKNGDQPLAISRLEMAVAQNPDLRMARTVLGRLYRDRGEYDAAARQYEALARLDPYTVENHYYLGVSYQFLKRYTDSIRAYLKGLEIDPTDFKSNMNVGTVLLATGETEQAIKYLDKATQLDAKSSAAWSNLGVALDARGSYVLAETAYRKALQLETNSLAVIQNLANNLLLQQKVGEATYLWEQVVKQKPTPFNRTRLADAYTQGGDFSAAETVINETLKSDPRFVPGLNARARLLVRKYEISGFTDETARKAAVAAAKQSLALNSEQPSIADIVKKYQTALPLTP
ncbi:MAG: tetratricopeptide repeat protein [Tepidisphaeraceae bacterium]